MCGFATEPARIYLHSYGSNVPVINLNFIIISLHWVYIVSFVFRQSSIDPLKRNGVRRLHFEVFSAIQI